MSVDSALATINLRKSPSSLAVPSALPAPGDSPVDPALLRPALSSVVKRAEGCLTVCKMGWLRSARLRVQWPNFDDALAVLAAELSPPMQPLQNWAQPNSHRRGGEEGAIADQQEAEERVIADFGPLLAEACAIYDSYFGVVRVSSLTLWQLTGQVVATSRAICVTCLIRCWTTQIVMLVANTGRMLTILAQRLSRQTDNAASQPALAQSAAAAQREDFASAGSKTKLTAASGARPSLFTAGRWAITSLICVRIPSAGMP